MPKKSPPPPREIDPRVEKVRGFMKAHLRERPTLEQFARAAGNIASGRLLQLFRATGESPCRAFKRIKMQEAARLLMADPEVSVKEVALKLGYGSDSLAQFSRDFGGVHRMPPGRYRKAARGRNRVAATAGE